MGEGGLKIYGVIIVDLLESLNFQQLTHSHHFGLGIKI